MGWRSFCALAAVVVFAVATALMHETRQFLWMLPAGLAVLSAAHI